MADYKMVSADINDGVFKIEEGLYIPCIPANADWQQYLLWVDAGGVPDPWKTEAELAQMAYDERVAQTKADIGICDALFLQDAQQDTNGLSTLTAAQKALINAFHSALDGHLKAVAAAGPSGTLPAYPHYNGASLDYYVLVYGV